MSKFISLSEAKKMISLYQNEQENILKDGFQNKQILATSELIDKEKLEKILKIPGCNNIRIYYGMDSTLKIHSILVAVDEKGQDIILQTENNYQNEEDILNDSVRCPPFCNTSPLTP